MLVMTADSPYALFPREYRNWYDVTIATVWAYFRQLSGDEIYRVTTQATEEVMFRINYRSDITTAQVIKYKDTLYNITRVDVYEGYKRDLTLYCKKQ